MSVGNKIALRRSEHLTIVLTFTFEIAEDLPASKLLRLPELDTLGKVVQLDFPHPSILSDLHPQFMWSAKRTPISNIRLPGTASIMHSLLITRHKVESTHAVFLRRFANRPVFTTTSGGPQERE